MEPFTSFVNELMGGLGAHVKTLTESNNGNEHDPSSSTGMRITLAHSNSNDYLDLLQDQLLQNLSPALALV